MPDLPDAPWASKESLPDAPWAASANELPQPFVNRVVQGEFLKQSYDKMMEKPYSERLKDWSAERVKEGNYQAAFSAGMLSLGAQAIEFPFELLAAGAKHIKSSLTDTLYTTGLHKEDYSDNPNAPEPQDALIQTSFNIAKDTMLLAGGGVNDIRIGNRPLLHAGDHIARPETDTDGALRAQAIGTIPKDIDFKTSAELLGRPEITEPRLRELWEQQGIHPAEAVYDSKLDTFLRHELTAPITAYHGSPYSFEAFSMEHIGTGEGAQSYGHGLYFAEHPEVAGQYAERLSGVGFAGKHGDAADEAIFWLAQAKKDKTVAREQYEANAKKNGEPVDQLVVDKIENGVFGRQYQVRLHVNKDHMLDWDKPASQQPPGLKQAYKDAGMDMSGATDGADAYHQLVTKLGSKEAATKVLHDAGIPGIKYLDQNSRTASNLKLLEANLKDTNELIAELPSKWGNQAEFRRKPLEEQKARIEALIEQNKQLTHNLVLFSDKDVEITHINGELFYDANFKKAVADDVEKILTGQAEGDIPLRAVGAEVTSEPPLIPLPKEPTQSPGKITTTAKNAMDQLFGLAKNIQYLVDPMATGSPRAMVIAKDAISSVRRARWEHARIEEQLEKSPDLKAARTRLGESIEAQQERMWNAADEESVLRQEIGGKEGGNYQASKEHMGLATLEPEERAYIEYLHGRAQAAWLHARDAGLVEGEGLPAYTPRMVVNVAAGAEHGSPQALNELGRNVFTRTAQMKHRAYMTTEETEAAAKAMVTKRMTERGASPEEIKSAVDKVEVARNIRALPLATARLEEAAIWRDMINKIEDIGKATGKDTVANFNPGEGWFTIAGNPAFTKWEPALVKTADGKFEIRMDDSGKPLFVPKQIYMPDEFRGPMSSILDEGPSKSKAVRGAQSLYGALMEIKGRSMQAILNSPMIHYEVVWSKVAEAAGGREWLGFGLYAKGNRIIYGNPARASELIERGLNPMGPRGSIQDITAMMEDPTQRMRSWTARLARAIPDLFNEKAGAAVEHGINKMGDFYHNTLLWDRVRDVQFGLADHLSDRLVAKGADRLTADRVAAHFSNIIVGSIPKEAMSGAARATANMLLFSRSFTLGNLSTFKQAALGLPKPILAQIERDFGISAEAALGLEGAAQVSQTATSIARRKAISTIMLSAGLYYIGNALIQHGMNIAARDSTIEEEMAGYARRYANLMKDAGEDPFELRHLIGRLSPTYDNEPKKQDRAHVGYDKDGTALYARNPTGKFGEEMIGYPTMPLEMIRRKLSPMAGGILDVLENDKGFGRKIYDENDKTISGDVKNAFAVAKHLVMKHLPESQITAAIDLLRDDGDPTVNKLRVFGPMAGFTVSVGAPGGQARGEQLTAKNEFNARFNLAWPDIKKQIQRGDLETAQQNMAQIGVPPWMQKGLIRNANNPAAALHGRTLRDFYATSTPEQRDRMDRARSSGPMPR